MTDYVYDEKTKSFILIANLKENQEYKLSCLSCSNSLILKENKLIHSDSNKTECTYFNLYFDNEEIETFEDTVIIPSDKIEDLQNCELADMMGFCHFKSEWDISRERLGKLCWDINSYEITVHWRQFNKPNSEQKEYVEEFLARSQCLCCSKFCQTTIREPFCKKCFFTILRDKTTCMAGYLSRSLLQQIRKYFMWIIEEIPESNYKYFGKCIDCNKRKLNIDFYGLRTICIDCLIKRHDEKYPNGMFFKSEGDDLELILLSYFSSAKDQEIVDV